jgi:hypothetical protein
MEGATVPRCFEDLEGAEETDSTAGRSGVFGLSLVFD